MQKSNSLNQSKLVLYTPKVFAGKAGLVGFREFWELGQAS